MENVGAGDLSLPQNEMHTTAWWLTVPSDVLQALDYTPEQRVNGVFGLSYLLHHVAPLFLMCDVHDIGVSHRRQLDRRIPAAPGARGPGRRGRRGPGGRDRGFRAQHLHLRQLPRRHRPEPGPLPAREEAPRARPQDHRGLPLQGRLSLLRRPDQGERPPGQAGRAGYPQEADLRQLTEAPSIPATDKQLPRPHRGGPRRRRPGSSAGSAGRRTTRPPGEPAPPR